jgi:hypothetical protein
MRHRPRSVVHAGKLEDGTGYGGGWLLRCGGAQLVDRAAQLVLDERLERLAGGRGHVSESCTPTPHGGNRLPGRRVTFGWRRALPPQPEGGLSWEGTVVLSARCTSV